MRHKRLRMSKHAKRIKKIVDNQLNNVKETTKTKANEAKQKMDEVSRAKIISTLCALSFLGNQEKNIQLAMSAIEYLIDESPTLDAYTVIAELISVELENEIPLFVNVMRQMKEHEDSNVQYVYSQLENVGVPTELNEFEVEWAKEIVIFRKCGKGHKIEMLSKVVPETKSLTKKKMDEISETFLTTYLNSLSNVVCEKYYVEERRICRIKEQEVVEETAEEVVEKSVDETTEEVVEEKKTKKTKKE